MAGGRSDERNNASADASSMSFVGVPATSLSWVRATMTRSRLHELHERLDVLDT
jgi:hypothetical protein